MPEKKKRTGEPRLFWRGGRAWAELRPIGGGRVPLVVEGEKSATTDPELARHLFEAAVAELRGRTRQRVVLGIDPDADLKAIANLHLDEKRAAGSTSASWLGSLELYLQRAALFFMVERHRKPGKVSAESEGKEPVEIEPRPCNLHTLTVKDIRAYVAWLRSLPTGREDETMSNATVRLHLVALSAVFARAISEMKLPMGHNPVAALMDKPKVKKGRTAMLEPWDLALLIEAARHEQNEASSRGGAAPLPCAPELLAFMIYTGAREGEARAVDVGDVHLAGGYVELHGTKTDGSDRVVPLAPHLAEILRAYLAREGRLHGPLFTTGARDPETGAPRRVGDWRKTLDRIAARVGFPAGSIRTRRFRVSYATHRCTCDDADANTVRLELGHTDLAMMAQVYARAQRRAERMGAELSFRLERWERFVPAERLASLAARPPREPRPAELEAAELVRRFLVSVEGKGARRVQAETGVDDAIVKRLRAGTQKTVQGRTLEKMRAHLGETAPTRGAA